MHKEKVQAEKDLCPEGFLRQKEPPAAGSLCSENCTCEQSCVLNHEHLGTRGGHAQAQPVTQKSQDVTEPSLQAPDSADIPETKQGKAGTSQSSGVLLCYKTHPWSTDFPPSTQRTSVEVSVNDRSLSN